MAKGPEAVAVRPRLASARLERGIRASILAWVCPGAGHWYVGARRRAVAFFCLVAAAVTLGVAFDGNLSVLDSRQPVISALQVGSNLALGPWEPLLRLSLYGAPLYSAPPKAALTGPRHDREFATWSAYGSAYLALAGLMNILLMLDAWDIAIGRKT